MNAAISEKKKLATSIEFLRGLVERMCWGALINHSTETDKREEEFVK